MGLVNIDTQSICLQSHALMSLDTPRHCLDWLFFPRAKR
jgi:hypothetical protein